MALKTSHTLPDPVPNVLMSDATQESAGNIHHWLICCTNFHFSALFCLPSGFHFGNNWPERCYVMYNGTSNPCTRTAQCACRKSQTVLFYYDCSATVQEIVRQCCLFSDVAYPIPGIQAWLPGAADDLKKIKNNAKKMQCQNVSIQINVKKMWNCDWGDC